MTNLKPTGRWWLPNVMDARVLSVVLFWLVMVVTSALSRTGLPRIDAVDLWLPWWAGVDGILVALVLLMWRPQRRTLFHAALAGGIALMLHFTAASLMGIPKVPEDGFGGRPYGLKLESLDELLGNGWVLAFLALGVCFTIQMSLAGMRGGFKQSDTQAPDHRPARSTSAGWFGRLTGIRPFIIRHRVGVMAGFVAVMIPLIMLRNIFDQNFQSTPYLVLPAVLFVAVVTGIVVLPILARLMARSGWGHWAFLVFVIAIVVTMIMCWDEFQRGLNRGKFDIGKTFAPATFTMMCLGTLLSGLVDQFDSKRRPNFTKVSLLSPIFILSAGVGWGYGLWTYDVRVVALSLAQQPREFLEGNWVDAAKHSRDLMRLTGGAARYLPDRYQSAVEIQIRGRQDAEVIDRLSQMRFKGSQNLVVRDVQPFVDLSKVGTVFASVRFVGGELGEDQMRSMTGRLQGLALDSVALPSALGNNLTLVHVSVYSDEPVAGLARFLDGCTRNGARFIYLHTPLTMADWESAVRNSGKKTYVTIIDAFLPDGVASSAAIDSATDLSQLSIHPNGLVDRPELLKLAVENGLNLTSVQIDEDRQWDVLVAAPHVWNWIPRVPRGDRDVSTYANDCRWSYDWDEDGQITQLWMPGTLLQTKEFASLERLKTLRLDCRGFMEPLQSSLGPLSVLGALTSLERLQLADVPVDSLKFLSGFVNLKHLQIHAPERGTNVPGSFAVCTNLETIRLFGAPLAATVQQLATLPNLRRVEVIDDRAELMNPVRVAKLRTSLPGVELVVTPTANYDPELSERFVRHRQNVRREVLDWIDAEFAKDRDQ